MAHKLKSLEALIHEACECARDCNLAGRELQKFARDFAGDMAEHLHAVAADALSDHHHFDDKRAAQNAATDVTNRIIAGPAPSKRHLLCSCNRAWVRSERDTSTTRDGVIHGYHDCQ